MKSERENIGSLAPVNIPGIEKILHQMKNCVCKIKVGNVSSTGFFCKIPIINMIFLMTNLHVITEEYLNENKEITVSKNDDKEILVIDLTIEREKYFNKAYDIAAIELKENDGIKEYLEFDDNILKDNKQNYYGEKSIYILNYLYGNDICISFSLIDEISKNDILYVCSTDKGS